MFTNNGKWHPDFPGQEPPSYLKGDQRASTIPMLFAFIMLAGVLCTGLYMLYTMVAFVADHDINTIASKIYSSVFFIVGIVAGAVFLVIGIGSTGLTYVIPLVALVFTLKTIFSNDFRKSSRLSIAITILFALALMTFCVAIYSGFFPLEKVSLFSTITCASIFLCMQLLKVVRWCQFRASVFLKK